MSNFRGADGALIGVAAVWGSSYLAAKVATDVAPVAVVVWGRYVVAAVAAFALLAGRSAVARRAGFVRRGTRGARVWPTRAEASVGWVLGVTQAAVLVLETVGVAHTSAANAGVLISLAIMVTPLAEAMFGWARVPRTFYLAGVCCLIGVALIVSAHGWGGLAAGDLLVLGAAVVRGIHVALIGRYAAAARPFQLTAIQLAVGAVLTLPWALFATGGRLGAAIVGHGPALWLAVAYLALGCSLAAFLAQTWAVQQTSASRASLLLGTEPVWALAVAVVATGQGLTVMALAGAAMLIGGTYYGQAIEAKARAGVRMTTRPKSQGAPA